MNIAVIVSWQMDFPRDTPDPNTISFEAPETPQPVTRLRRRPLSSPLSMLGATAMVLSEREVLAGRTPSRRKDTPSLALSTSSTWEPRCMQEGPPPDYRNLARTTEQTCPRMGPHVLDIARAGRSSEL